MRGFLVWFGYVRSRLFGERRLTSRRAANLCVISRDHAPKARMGRTGIGRRSSASAGTITLTIGGVAKEGTSFDHALGRVRIAWIITLSRATWVATNVFACGLNVSVYPIPVAAPLPDVAGHVVQAVAICREGHRGRTAAVSTAV
jgi:hypothetical protein